MNKIEHPKKAAMLQALEKTLGIVTAAAKMVPISPVSHYAWLKDDEDYAKAVSEVSNMTLDFAESKLLELINSGDTTATIFFLKTKGRERGYIESRHHDHTSNGKTLTMPTFLLPDEPTD